MNMRSFLSYCGELADSPLWQALRTRAGAIVLARIAAQRYEELPESGGYMRIVALPEACEWRLLPSVARHALGAHVGPSDEEESVRLLAMSPETGALIASAAKGSADPRGDVIEVRCEILEALQLPHDGALDPRWWLRSCT